MAEQLPIFGFRDNKPKAKVPISADRIREVQALIEKGEVGPMTVEKLRDLRYKLENYCNRISNK